VKWQDFLGFSQADIKKHFHYQQGGRLRLQEDRKLELREQIAGWLKEYCPKYDTTESGWVIIPEVAKERYLKDADKILAFVKEAGYVRLAKDQALPSCRRFEWWDIDECKTKCDLEQLERFCPLIKGNWRRVEKE